MSERSVRLLLEDMLEAIDKVLEYTRDLSFEKFLEQSMAREAVYRNLEVIGEASDKLPVQFITSHPGIAWSKLIGFRNV